MANARLRIPAGAPIAAAILFLAVALLAPVVPAGRPRATAMTMTRLLRILFGLAALAAAVFVHFLSAPRELDAPRRQAGVTGAPAAGGEPAAPAPAGTGPRPALPVVPVEVLPTAPPAATAPAAAATAPAAASAAPAAAVR